MMQTLKARSNTLHSEESSIVASLVVIDMVPFACKCRVLAGNLQAHPIIQRFVVADFVIVSLGSLKKTLIHDTRPWMERLGCGVENGRGRGGIFVSKPLEHNGAICKVLGRLS